MTSGKVTAAEANPETAARFDELVEAFAALRDKSVTAAFLRDLCTTNEIDAMGQRLQVARLVNDGVSYQEISRRTGASTATITRVAQWLHYGEGGYAAILKRSRR
ncbi:MAG TPA: YerC/YecD family TrpR-related protein [Acidimicrobiales bacterium]|nr:YerC/YecD family TrpR-related protein [Acidimicrobiales bacterium]